MLTANVRTALFASAAVLLAAAPAFADDHGHKNKDKGMAGDSPSKSIVELAVATPELSTLVAALKAADLVEALEGEGPFTVFAPTNDAFAELGDAVQDLLKPENKQKLQGVLLYHVINGAVFAEDLVGMVSDEETLQGGTVTIDGNDGVMVNDSAVTTADVAATNGVVHIIDAVLMPPAPEDAEMEGDME